jgi:cytochrome b561
MLARPLIGQDRSLAKQLLGLHETVRFVLLGLIGTHAAAALYHHFWRRDDTLVAMLPQATRREPHRQCRPHLLTPAPLLDPE